MPFQLKLDHLGGFVHGRRRVDQRSPKQRVVAKTASWNATLDREYFYLAGQPRLVRDFVEGRQESGLAWILVGFE